MEARVKLVEREKQVVLLYGGMYFNMCCSISHLTQKRVVQ